MRFILSHTKEHFKQAIRFFDILHEVFSQVRLGRTIRERLPVIEVARNIRDLTPNMPHDSWAENIICLINRSRGICTPAEWAHIPDSAKHWPPSLRGLPEKPESFLF